MHPERKKRFENDLIADLAGASTRFEPLCYRLIEFIAPSTDWWHRGTTKTGAPVGDTVDSKAHGGGWVGEYSTDQKYFTPGLSKLAADITHARTLHPQVTRLWAMSSQEAKGEASTEIAQIIERERQARLVLVVLDARQIACLIVEQLLNDTLIKNLVDYLPTLKKIRDEWAASNQVPKNPDYVHRNAVETEIRRRLEIERAVVVTGIGGSGKSALCSALASQLEAAFEIVLWVDAVGIVRNEDLSSIDVLRNGDAMNVSGLMSSRPCLVVLDNLIGDIDLEGLLAQAHVLTRVLVTTQKIAGKPVVISSLEQDEAIAVLDPNGICPPDIRDQIIGAVGAHALLLKLLGAEAREEDGNWHAILRLLHDATGLGDSHGRVCDKILGRHRARLENAFRLITLAGARIDQALWDEVAGAPARRDFKERCFLANASPGVVRIHDNVEASIRQLLRGEDISPTARLVARFVENQMGEVPSMSLHRVVRTQFAMFERVLSDGHYEPAFRYAYALSRRFGMRLELLGDPLALARNLTSTRSNVVITVRSIIETIECIFTLIRETSGKNAARQKMATLLPVFDEMLLAIENLPERVRRDLEHHRGKALDRADRLPEAAAVFEALLKRGPDFPAARLQLARVLVRIPERASEAIAHLETVFVFAEQQSSNLGLSIVLAAFETLTWQALENDMFGALEYHWKLLVESLTQALRFGHEHPYKTIASLGLRMSVETPQRFLELAELVSSRPSPAEADQELFNSAQILKGAGVAWRELTDSRAEVAFADAVAFYSQIQRPNDFMITQWADCLLCSGRTSDAMDVLERAPEESRGEFWHYKKAEIARTVGNLMMAREYVERSLAVVSNRYRWMCLRERFLIRQLLDDSNAGEDLDAAILACRNERSKARLLAEREVYDATCRGRRT